MSIYIPEQILDLIQFSIKEGFYVGGFDPPQDSSGSWFFHISCLESFQILFVVQWALDIGFHLDYNESKFNFGLTKSDKQTFDIKEVIDFCRERKEYYKNAEENF